MSVKFKLSLGLASIVVTMLMFVQMLGLLPDKSTIVQKDRGILAESIAIHTTARVLERKHKSLVKDFEYLASRNDDLLSLGLRHKNGKLIAVFGDHESHWSNATDQLSIANQVKVPIWDGEEKWGELELRFATLNPPGILGYLYNPTVQLMALAGALGFVVFYFYLGKFLKVLDPSAAVPGRVRSALDTLAEGLLILDRKENIMLANQAFADLLDLPSASLVGQQAGKLPWQDKNGESLTVENRPWLKALRTGELQEKTLLRFKLGENRIVTFNVNCSPVLGANGKYAGVLVSFNDITELEKKEVELKKSKEAADAANEAKSAFLANMSHEIRTPMNAILGFTEILKRGYVQNEADSLKYLNIINSSGKGLLELINDILDLSKVESGKIEVELTRFSPYQILADTLQMLRLKTDEKGIYLNFEIHGEVPETIESDPTRLRQIVFNLVGNAIKFTDSGGVTVTCKLIEQQGNPMFTLEIADTGIGMTNEQCSRIFNPFVQADETVTRRFGGTGLGLTISKKFAEALGGNIVASSEAGKGSLFTMTVGSGDLSHVSLCTAEQITTDSGQDEHAGKDACWVFPNASVLVVDDGAENRELVRFLLEDAGLTVNEAENGRLGLEMSLQQYYEAIFMDVQMPEMDGFTAAGKMREGGITVPIVALTANAMKGFEAECLEAGYSGYFSKPIDVDRFMQYAAKLLNGKLQPKTDASATQKKRETTKALQQAATPAQAHSATALSAAEPIYSTLPTNNPKFQKIVRSFIGRLHEQMSKLDNAMQAEDHGTVADLAHWLKGAGGTVGFDVFTDPAGELEIAAKQYNLEIMQDRYTIIQQLVARLDSGADNTSAAQPQVQPQPPVAAPSKEISKPADNVTQPIVSTLADNPRLATTVVKFAIKLREEIPQMELLLQQGEMEELANAAHWLKGSAGTVGYQAFTQPALELENYAKSGDRIAVKGKLDEIKGMAAVMVVPEVTLPAGAS